MIFFFPFNFLQRDLSWTASYPTKNLVCLLDIFVDIIFIVSNVRFGLHSICGSGWILIPTSYQQKSLQFKVSHLGRVGCLHLFYPHTHTFCNVDKHRPDRQAHAPISMNQTQLAWILNLAHECSSFIDAAPEEKFTLPSNGSCFTLKFVCFLTVVTHGGCVTSRRHIACQVPPPPSLDGRGFAFRLTCPRSLVSYLMRVSCFPASWVNFASPRAHSPRGSQLWY